MSLKADVPQETREIHVQKNIRIRRASCIVDVRFRTVMHDSDTSKGRVAVASCCIGGWLVMRNRQIFCNAKGLSSDNAMGVESSFTLSYRLGAILPFFAGSQIKYMSDIVTGDNTLGK